MSVRHSVSRSVGMSMRSLFVVVMDGRMRLSDCVSVRCVLFSRMFESEKRRARKETSEKVAAQRKKVDPIWAV